MPQIPIIAPLVVIGLLFGAIVKSKSSRISKRKLVSSSLVAGVLNSIHAYLLYSLMSTRTVASFAGVPTGAPPMEGLASASEGVFVAASFLSALLMVLLVFGIAITYVRIRGSAELDEVPEQISEAEPAPAPS